MSGPEAFGGYNLPFVEELYQAYLADPASVDPEWRALFEPLRREEGAAPGARRPTRAPRSIFNPAPAPGANGGATTAAGEAKLLLQDRLDQLVAAYRSSGHLEAKLDPLGRAREGQPVLDPAYYGLSEADMDERCSYTSLEGSVDMTVRQVIRRMRNTYCRGIGVQFTHMDDREARGWLQERMESTENRLRLTLDDQRHILAKLIDAEVFEQFIRKKWLGAKSFSLEGGESLIPLLDLAIERGAEQGIEEVVLGMAHRGRLNVLANIMHKHPREIFREFEDTDNEKYWGRGDVKYHLGFRTDHVTRQGHKVRLRLAFNPSHLEFVSPVVLGRCRARQDRIGDYDRRRVLPVVLHGDSAFAGQGITQETLNMSGLPGYHVGGALHVIVNNQIGFTTPPELARSSGYSTDVALMLRVPIFHVNGEDPESVAQVVQLAMDFREKFRQDVFIDFYCYRRHGHNEGDEPSFTQPLMYKVIRARPTVRESYLERLSRLPNGLKREEADAIIAQREGYLEEELSKAREKDYQRPKRKTSGWPWKGFVGGRDRDVPDKPTAVPRERLVELLRKACHIPEDFALMRKLARVIVDQRLEMAEGERALDWAAGELLAYATLLTEGHHVRISGQDVGRGTFSHRHAILRDQETEKVYMPLLHLEEGQSWFEVWDSPLSENSVLGYEYGYSLDRPQSLVIWEAQFGDFVNGAQVIIDQFISSAEDKWELLSGLVLLLPHGFEGQGPEHSSARLERFLQLGAEDNMQVVYPTTPAQIFHALRRQCVRAWRKPLIVMSPKSLLRHPKAVSTLDELTTGGFQRVIPDAEPPAEVRKVLLCSGRIFYDLVEYRDQREQKEAAIVRVEQLYPFPEEELKAAIEPLRARAAPEGLEVVWVQEEPENMGAWWALRAQYGDSLFGLPLSVAARNASASPATGSPRSHKREQEFLITRAFYGQQQALQQAQQQQQHA